MTEIDSSVTVDGSPFTGAFGADNRYNFVMGSVSGAQAAQGPQAGPRGLCVWKGRALACLILLCSIGACAPVHGQKPAALKAFLIDVEGGEATLFVTPTGESLLIDAGWPGFGGRDAGRIADVARKAGVKQIDTLVVTHFHVDHMGGVAQLAERLPIRRIVDHGETVDKGEQAETAFRTYAAIRSRSEHIVATPGASIPIRGLDVRVIAAGGKVLEKPLAGAGQVNPACAGFKFHGEEITSRAGNAEDDQSVSLLIGYGAFRTIIMGDLNWNKEHPLMCPENKVGTIDVYFVSHHGADTSGSAAFVHPLRPRVAIMNNGARKGGAAATFPVLRESRGLEDIWQSHYSIPAAAANAPEQFIANLETEPAESKAPHNGPANWIELSATADRRFTVTNSRNGFSKQYSPN